MILDKRLIWYYQIIFIYNKCEFIDVFDGYLIRVTRYVFNNLHGPGKGKGHPSQSP